MIGAISLLLFVACALLAFIDLRRGIIPNWLNLAIAGVARAALIESATSAFAARSSACGAWIAPAADAPVRVINAYPPGVLWDAEIVPGPVQSILVVIVVFFLGSVRATLIPTIAVPVSLVLGSGVVMARAADHDLLALAISAATTGYVVFTSRNPLWALAVAALAGIARVHVPPL